MVLNLLGKPLSGNLEKQAFDQEILHNLNMGYVRPDKLTPHSAVGYYEQENNFIHPWSMDRVGYVYGFGKLSETIPLKEYLTLPSCLVDELIPGIERGRESRSKADERIRKEREEREKTGKDPIQEAMRKQGLIP